MSSSSEFAFSLILLSCRCEYLATSDEISFSFLICASSPVTSTWISAGNICCLTGTGAVASLLLDSDWFEYPAPPRPGFVAVVAVRAEQNSCQQKYCQKKLEKIFVKKYCQKNLEKNSCQKNSCQKILSKKILKKILVKKNLEKNSCQKNSCQKNIVKKNLEKNSCQ